MNGLIIKDFEAAVLQYPEQIAIEDAFGKYKYKDLNTRSNRLSWTLKSIGVQPEVIVSVMMQPGNTMISALLAIFKAGGIYMPVDSAYPKKRIRHIFQRSSSEIIITDKATQAQVRTLIRELALPVKHLLVAEPEGDWQYVSMDTIIGIEEAADGIEILFNRDENPPLNNKATDSNYIFFTSGSTGEPKAILGIHQSLLHFINWEKQEFKIGPDIRVSQIVHPTFDASLRDIFIPLTSGGTLCIPDVSLRSNLSLLVDWISESRINLMHCVPSLLRMLTKELANGSAGKPVTSSGATNATSGVYFPELKHILISGEPLYARDIDSWQKLTGKHIELTNLYGASETTLIKTFHRIKEIPANLAQSIHVGQPISDTLAILINTANKLCRIGEIGEIYIKTPYMTKGYFNNEELTKKVFVQNPLISNKTDIIYKTGDLGRYLPDRSIEVLGRLDDQVKINGIRVELDEIRHAVLLMEGVSEVYITADKNAGGQHELICYYVGDVDVDALRSFLNTELNAGLIPAYFMRMQELPLTLSGKIDKQALPKPDELFIPDEDFEPIENELEARLENIFREVLGLKRIGRKVSFFRIGGTSLKAMRVISLIYKELDISLRLADIFSALNIQNLALLISESAKTVYTAIEPAPIWGSFPLTNAQKRLWIQNQVQEGEVLYSMPAAFWLKGSVELPVMERVFLSLIERHESLRTVFSDIPGADVRQRILQPGELQFEINLLDLSPDANAREKAKKMVEEEASIPFDLVRGPLFRVKLLQLSPEEYVFVFNTHHIVSDGWSGEVMAREIFTLYKAYSQNQENPLPPLRIQYKDYAVWLEKQLHTESYKAQERYWQDRFSGELPVLLMPTDNPRPLQRTHNGANQEFSIDTNQTAVLQDFASKRSVSLFMLLTAVLNTLLYKYTGQKDIILAAPIAGRIHPDLKDQIGLFVNMFALRTRLDAEETFDSVLEKVKLVMEEAFANQLYPFDELIKSINTTYDKSRAPLTDIWVQWADEDFEYGQDFSGIQVHEYKLNHSSSKVDLTFKFGRRGKEIYVIIEYNTDLFNKSTMVSMQENFMHLLSELTTRDRVRLSEVHILVSDRQEAEASDFLKEFFQM